MKWLKRFISGDVELCVYGRNAERFFQLCATNGIGIERLARTGANEYHCHMAWRDVWDSRPYYCKTGMHCKIIRKKGLPFLLFRYRRRILFPLALCVVLYLMGYCSRFIWKVEINGNSHLTDEQLIAYLTENSASYGTAKSGIDCDAIELMLREDFDEVIWASVALEGTTLVIELQEKTGTGDNGAKDTDNSEGTGGSDGLGDAEDTDSSDGAEDSGGLGDAEDTDGSDDAENSDDADDFEEAENVTAVWSAEESEETLISYAIVADKDATIASIVTRRGLATVVAGDEVSVGDVLVEGLQEVLDDNGETKFWYAAIPDADIIGTVIYEYTDCISVATTVKTYGKTVLSGFYLQLPIGRLEIEFPFGTDENTEILESYYQIHLTEQFYLPFGIGIRQSIPVEEEAAERTDEEALALAETNLEKYLEGLEEDGVVILSKTVTMHKEGNEYLVEGEITAEEEIGTVILR